MKLLYFINFCFRRCLRKITEFFASLLSTKDLEKISETILKENIVRDIPASLFSVESLKEIGLLNLIAKSTEVYQSGYLTYHIRSVFTEQIKTTPDNFYLFSSIAVVLQGQVVKENDFTFESLKLYKKLFPKSQLILSTWDDEDPYYLAKFYSENIIIILNKKPHNTGIRNLNFQIVSSYYGIQKAKELNCQYVLKTRTDQRIYAPNTESVLLNLLKSFPLKKKLNCQTGRIIAISFNTFKYRLYSLSDMLLFGYTLDLEMFWDVPLDIREDLPSDWDNTIISTEKNLFPEAYLLTSYLTKMGYDLNWNILDSWNVYANFFCIVDKELFDLYWPKYNKLLENRNITYDFIRTSKEFSFADWLNFQSNNYLGELTDEMRGAYLPAGSIVKFSPTSN